MCPQHHQLLDPLRDQLSHPVRSRLQHRPCSQLKPRRLDPPLCRPPVRARPLLPTPLVHQALSLRRSPQQLPARSRPHSRPPRPVQFRPRDQQLSPLLARPVYLVASPAPFQELSLLWCRRLSQVVPRAFYPALSQQVFQVVHRARSHRRSHRRSRQLCPVQRHRLSRRVSPLLSRRVRQVASPVVSPARILHLAPHRPRLCSQH